MSMREEHSKRSNIELLKEQPQQWLPPHPIACNQRRAALEAEQHRSAQAPERLCVRPRQSLHAARVTKKESSLTLRTATPTKNNALRPRQPPRIKGTRQLAGAGLYSATCIKLVTRQGAVRAAAATES